MIAVRDLSKKYLSLALAVVAILISVGAKLSLTTGELLPGLDGAYYWVQVRSLLTDFTLAFEDLPLVLWVQALLALITGDIPLGVRLSDALLPALSAIPIYLILRNSGSRFAPFIGILAVLLHPVQLYFFTGEFIKNEASIPIVFFIGWVLYSWDSRQTRRSVIYLVASLGVLALAHFGTLLLALLITAIWLIFLLRKMPVKYWILGGLAALALLGLVLLALAILVPGRYERLLDFVSSASVIFANPTIAEPLLPFVNAGFGDRAALALIFTIWLGQIGSIVLGILLWRSKQNLTESRLALVASGAISTALLSSPLIGAEWSYRLSLLSFVPLLLSCMVLWKSIDSRKLKKIPALIAVSGLLASTLLTFSSPRMPVASAAEYQDLQEIFIANELPEKSIVMADHGVHYLIAWAAKVTVVPSLVANDTDWNQYNAIFELRRKRTDSPPYGYGYRYSYLPPMPKGDGKVGQPTKGSEVLNSSGEVVYENESYTLVRLR